MDSTIQALNDRRLARVCYLSMSEVLRRNLRGTKQQHFAYLSCKLPGKERNEVFRIQSCEAFQRFSAAYSPLIICKLLRIHSFTLSSQKLFLLYGKLRERAVCGEFCVLIGYPSGQDGAILPARDCPFRSRK